MIHIYAESPMMWDNLPRLRPTAGLAYEKHTWLAGTFDGVPGLALRRRGPAALSLPVDRVAVVGAGAERLIAALFEGGVATRIDGKVQRSVEGTDALQATIADLLIDPLAHLVATTPPAGWSEIASLTLTATFVTKAWRVATAIAGPGHPVQGFAIYQATHTDKPLAVAVAEASKNFGLAVEWLDDPAPVAVDLGLPPFEALPIDDVDPLDLTGFNLAQLPCERSYREVILDDTAVTDLGPLSSWHNLEAVSLRRLEVRTLQPIRRVQRVTLEQPTPERIAPLEGTQHLVLHGVRLSDLRCLRKLRHLQTLEIHGTELGALDGIEQLSELRQLVLAVPSPPPLAPVGALSELSSLAVRFHGRFDAHSLPALRSLLTLELSGLDGHAVHLDRPADLARFAALMALDLTATDLTETDWLGELGSLRRLALAATDFVSFPALERLDRLEYLDLSACRLSDLSEVSRSSHLRHLDISGLTADLVPLHLPELRKLRARGMPLADLGALAGCGALAVLELGGAVASLRGVERLRGLESLAVPELLASDLTPLEGLPRLERLDLTRVPFSTIGVLGTLPALTSIDLSHTPCSDLSLLSSLPLCELGMAGRVVDGRLFDTGEIRARLRIANFNGADITSFEALQGLGLTTLDLSGASFACPDRMHFPSLRELDLSLTKLPSFEAVSELNRLRTLRAGALHSRLDHSPLLELAPLARLEVDRGRVPPPLRWRLAQRHHLILRGE